MHKRKKKYLTMEGRGWRCCWRGAAHCGVLLCTVAAVYAFMHRYSSLTIAEYQLGAAAGRQTCELEPVLRPPRLLRRPAIGLLTLLDTSKFEPRFAGFQRLIRTATKNKQTYTARHGYTLVSAGADDIDRTRPAAWSKLLALRKNLARFDWLVYFDADTLVMNQAVELECYIDDRYDVVMTSDWNGLNFGVFMVRNTSWSEWFLDALWAQRQLVDDNSLPFHYEQRAVHYLAQTPLWQRLELPVYKGVGTVGGHDPREKPCYPPVGERTSEAINRHIKVLPQCAMNSYVPRPITAFQASYHKRELSKFAPGDFVLHFAGHAGSNKVRLFEYFAAMTNRMGPPANWQRGCR